MVTAVLSAIHKRHPELQWRPFFDVLAGGPYLRTALQGGLPVNGILESMRESLEDFSLRRPRLYQTLEERERL
jgi:hypothetical protein